MYMKEKKSFPLFLLILSYEKLDITFSQSILKRCGGLRRKHDRCCDMLIYIIIQLINFQKIFQFHIDIGFESYGCEFY